MEQVNYNLTDSLKYSCPFNYPEEPKEQPEVDLSIFNQFIQKISSYLLSSKNPHLVLCALLFSSGYDCGLMLGVNNTETEIAKCLGISKQRFSLEVKRVRKELGIYYCNTGKKSSSKDNYKTNNYRKI